jgi:hypothetical protein
MSENTTTDESQSEQPETPAEDEQRFTQSEVNQIVKERIARERAKYQGFDELKEKAAKTDELQSQLEKTVGELDGIKKAQTLRELKAKIAAENNIPAELLEGDTEEKLKAKAEVVKKYVNKAPVLPNQADVPGEPGVSEIAEYIRNLFSGGQQQ